MSFRIIGTGSYVPEKVVTNFDLANVIETSDEWIRQRVGIAERRISTDKSAAEMGYNAAVKALEMSNVSPDELDLIIVASISNDTTCPTAAGTIQKMLGANCAAFDVNSACSGFIFALDTAAGFFARGKAKKALVVGCERMSKIIDWHDRGTCVIFGDGAGAAVLETGNGYLESKISTFGGDNVIKIPSGTESSPYYIKSAEPQYVFMDGQETFKFAVNTITSEIQEITEKAGLSVDDIKYVVPHQANIRIIQYASKRLSLPMDKFFVNIEKYGNTSAASIPMALDELNRSGGLKSDDIIVMTAFGGGLSSATCIIKW